jgi:hypothetical protein
MSAIGLPAADPGLAASVVENSRGGVSFFQMAQPSFGRELNFS